MDLKEAMRRMFPPADEMPMRYAHPGDDDLMRWLGWLVIGGTLIFAVAVIVLVT